MRICDDFEPEVNVFPSAGMTLLRGIPVDLANRVRAALTFRNPDFKPPKDAAPGQYEEAHIRLWAPHEEGTLVPRYYWHHELGAYGRVELVVGDVGDFHHTLQFPPRENQLQITRQLDAWDGDVNINGPCAFGKALANCEPILTPDGEKHIGDAQVGDLVAGTDGRFHEVTGVYPQGIRELFRVTFTDGTHVDCDGEHLWTLQQRREVGKPHITIKLSDLLKRKLRNSAGRKYYLPELAPVSFKSDTSRMPIAPYTLGALLGDGHIGTKSMVQITTADSEILSYMDLPSAHRFIPLHDTSSGKAETYRISMNRSDAQELTSIWDHLGALELAGRTSHSKFIPPTYKFSSVEDRLELLRGLFDTDGHAGHSFCVEYATVSRQLAEDVQWVVSSLGGTCVVAARNTRYTTKDGGRSKWFPSFRLTVKLPKSMNPFRLSRKSAEYSAVKRQREPQRAVEKIEQIESGLATCISVASPNRLFLTRNCVPTHNTFVAFYYAAKTPGRILVIVPNNNKMDEWRREAMRFLGLRADQVGTIQGSRRDWRNCPVVIAMSKTLAVQAFDLEIASAFASVISDETHLASAPIISQALGKIGGKRMALTATPGGGLRRDIIEYHFGKNWLVPQVPRMQTRYEFLPVPVWERLRKMDWEMQRTMVGRDEFYSGVAARVCNQLVAQGRRVLVLGNQIEPLMHVHRLTGKTGGFVVGVESLDRIAMTFGEVRLHLEGRTEPRKKDRAGGYMSEVKTSMNPILGIGLTKTQPAGTGMDVEDLDGGVIMLPIGGRDTVTQIRGRYERVHPTKKNPLVVVMFPDTDSGRDTAEAMAAHLRAGDAEVVFHEPLAR